MAEYTITVDHPRKNAKDQATYATVLRRDKEGQKAVFVARTPIRPTTNLRRLKRRATKAGNRIVKEDKTSRSETIRSLIRDVEERRAHRDHHENSA
jgi:hypothetical protein